MRCMFKKISLVVVSLLSRPSIGASLKIWRDGHPASNSSIGDRVPVVQF